jgi:hypothetical protein
MDDKHASDGGSDPKEVHTAHYVLDERRRAALAEIDNASFSYGHFMTLLLPLSTLLGGSTLRCAPSLALASSRMRKFFFSSRVTCLSHVACQAMISLRKCDMHDPACLD